MIDRQKIKSKYGGLCAYSGKPLDEKWQVDHIVPVSSIYWSQPMETRKEFGINAPHKNHIDNLVPCISIINHYKRYFDLEGFRKYLLGFHLRLKKLPKKTNCPKAKKRIVYMNTIADLFGISEVIPFRGKFYFETISNDSNNRGS